MSKILVVDDEPKIRFIVRKMLEKEGHKVAEAKDGAECLEMVKAERPDLILLDVMMPGMDGWDVCRRIKTDEATKTITVAMLTVKSKDEDKVKSFDEALADWHVVKPFTGKTLSRTVQWLLERPFTRG